MTKREFLQRYPQFTKGTIVRSRNGEKLGSVLAVREKDIIIEKGFFFPKDYVVIFDQVEKEENGELILKHHSEEMIQSIRDEELIPGQALESATPQEPLKNHHPTINERVA